MCEFLANSGGWKKVPRAGGSVDMGTANIEAKLGRSSNEHGVVIA